MSAAFLERGGHNVLVLDWSPLARYPCYADAVRHSRVAALCGAQVLSALQAALGALGSPLGSPFVAVRPPAARWAASGVAVGAPVSAADLRLASCVGHSLGAHICGMLSRQLPSRLFKVVGECVPYCTPTRPYLPYLPSRHSTQLMTKWLGSCSAGPRATPSRPPAW